MFGGLIRSHILLQDLDRFISIVNSLVSRGGTLVFINNNFVVGGNLPVTKTDEFGNTFQLQKLDDDTSHEVLKKFPAEVLLRNRLHDSAGALTFYNYTYYWMTCYTTKA